VPNSSKGGSGRAKRGAATAIEVAEVGLLAIRNLGLPLIMHTGCFKPSENIEFHLDQIER
jgi:hypothetical protein